MKKIVIGFGLLLAAVIIAALIAPSFVDFNDYKTEIAEQVRSATGRDLAIEGDISLALLPAPSLSVEDVKLGNLPGATGPEMVTLKSLDVRVSFLPLLRGEVSIERIRVVDPVVLLEVLPDGRRNWQFSAREDAVTEGGRVSGADEGASASTAPAIAFKDVVVENATVIYRDPEGGIDERLQGLDATISADSLYGPLHLGGKTVVNGLPVDFRLELGSFAGHRQVPVKADIGVANGAAKVSFSGSVAEPAGDGKITGTLKVESGDLRHAAASILAAAGVQGRAIPAALAQPTEMTARVEGSARDVSLNDINMKLGETLATGAVSLAFAEAPSLDGTLKINRLNLDAVEARTAERDGSAGGATQTGQKSPQRQGDAQASAFIIPAELSGSLNVEVGALVWHGAIVRQLRLDASLQNGELQVRRAAALAPGGSDIAISGAVKATAEGPRFDGQLEAASNNFRAVLDWLKVDLSGVPADRMRSMQLASTVALTPELIQVYGIDLRVDASRVSGGLAYAFRERPSFSVDLLVDRFNADAYLASTVAQAGQPDAHAATATAPAGGSAGQNGGRPDMSFLEVLDRFDTNFKLAFDSLTLRNQVMQKVQFDASLIGGVLTVREFSVAQAAGASIALAGSAEGFSTNPVFALKGAARISDAHTFARFAGVTLPGSVKALGIPDITLDATGSLTKADLQLDANMASAHVTISGAINPMSVRDGGDLTFDLQAESLKQLADAFGFGEGAGGVKDGPFKAQGTLKGGMEAADVELSLSALGGEAKAGGRLRSLADNAAYGLAIAVHHPDLNALIRDLGVEAEPAARNLGALSLETKLSGDRTALSLSGLESQIGPVKMAGRGDMRFDGPRPKLTIDLRAGDILGDLFMPVPVTGPKGRIHTAADAGKGIPTPKERWSREPIDFSVLRAFDADVTLAAASIDVRGYAFSEPELALHLENAVLDVTKLKGRLFDGAAELTAKLNTADVPTAQIDINLTGADLAKALVQTAGVDAVTGRFGFSGGFRTSGRSQYDMIRALGGEGRLRARDGVVRGVNLKAVSDALGSRGDVARILALVAKATDGGETPYQSLDGTINVEMGVASSDDLVAVLQAGEATAEGQVDLPRWTIDAAAAFRLTERTDAPPLGVSVRGPLDSPRKDVKTAALERFLAQRAATGILRKAIGKERLNKLLGEEQPQPGAAPQQPEASQAPVFGAPAQPAQPAPSAQPQQQPAPDPMEQLLNKGLKKLIK